MEDLWSPTSGGIVLVGLAAGVLSGMFGVGGAVLMKPGIRALGTSPIDAVGSTVPAILPGAISGASRYAREGLVDWRVGLICGSAGAVLALGGAWVSDLVDARWLLVLTAVMLGWSGLMALRQGAAGAAPEPGPELSADQDRAGRSAGAWSLAGIGATAGFVAGLVGVGGGIVMMPLFTNVLRIPVKQAVASSLVAVAIFSVPAMVSHAWLGHIDWRVALLLVAGTVPGAQVGSRITIGRPEATVRVLLGSFFIVVAVIYGTRELMGIL